MKKNLQGIKGWGLYVWSPELLELGELVDIGPVQGCRRAGCRHVSHAPAAPWRRWVPRVGTLDYLGASGNCEYYLLHDHAPRGRVFIRLRRGRPYYSWIDVVRPTQIPEDLLAQTGGER